MRIRNLMLMLACLFWFSAVQAQGVEDIGKIALSVIMPENVDGLTVSQLSKLESKIVQITTKAGVAASGYNQTFVIYPKFAVYETNVVEGGMQNITVVTTELSLYIKQVSNNMIFSSVTKSLKGSGKTKEIALTNAISQIPVTDKAFVTFVSEGKQKIIAYYEENCDDIVKKADTYIKMQQYEQALGLLMSVPEEIPACYDKVLSKSVETFVAYQNQYCAELLQQAKAKMAAQHYEEALEILAKIDPSSNCYAESMELFTAYQNQRCAEFLQLARAKMAAQDYEGALEILAKIDPSSNCYAEQQTLTKNIENKVSAEVKKQWDFQMKQYKDKVNLEKQRINAMKEIAVSYYQSQPTNVTYNYLIGR